MRDLKQNYETPLSPLSLSWFQMEYHWQKKKKERSLNRDDFESDISPLSSFNKIIPVSHEKRKVLIKHEGKTIASSKLNSFLNIHQQHFANLSDHKNHLEFVRHMNSLAPLEVLI